MHQQQPTPIRPGSIIPRWDSKTTRWRLYHHGTRRLVRNNRGTPVDGGGHRTETQALHQARAIKHSLRNRHENVV